MRKLMVMLGVLSLSLVSCGGTPFGGTETGNPSGTATNGANGSNSPGPDLSTEAGQILTAICNKLTACYPTLGGPSCISGIEAVTNLGSALGLSGASATESFQNITNAETSGAITPANGPASTCVADIQALTCASAGVTSAYSASSPGTFTNVVNMIPTSGSSCAGVY